MSHRCPGPECDRTIPDHMLMCRPHWYQVPQVIRNDVWAAWRNGLGAGTPEHNDAIRAAIKALREKSMKP